MRSVSGPPLSQTHGLLLSFELSPAYYAQERESRDLVGNITLVSAEVKPFKELLELFPNAKNDLRGLSDRRTDGQVLLGLFGRIIKGLPVGHGVQESTWVAMPWQEDIVRQMPGLGSDRRWEETLRRNWGPLVKAYDAVIDIRILLWT